MLKTENVNESFWMEIRSLCRSSKRERRARCRRRQTLTAEETAEGVIITWITNLQLKQLLVSRIVGINMIVIVSFFFDNLHISFYAIQINLSIYKNKIKYYYLSLITNIVVNILASYSESPEFKSRLWDCPSWLRSFLWFFGVRLPIMARAFKDPMQKGRDTILGFRKRIKI